MVSRFLGLPERCFSSGASNSSVKVMKMWLVRLRMAPRSAGTWLETLESRSFPYDSLLDDQFVGRELVVVLGVSDRAFQRLTDKAG